MNHSPSRPALRYHGGKWRLAPWIIGHFPPHTCYVEPFAGAASVLLRKAPARFEVMNDVDGEVVNFFRVLREQPAELLRVIEATPFSREESAIAYEPVGDPLERARRLYVRSWQQMGGPRAQWRSGWRFSIGKNGSHRSAVEEWGNNAHLWTVASRLKAVQIECDDALKVIARFDSPETLFYCDPPYVRSTRSMRWGEKAYKHEMDDAAHRELAKVLRGVRGGVILSGYSSPLYAELYAGWQRAEKEALTDKASIRTEVLWISPSVERVKAGLFAGGPG